MSERTKERGPLYGVALIGSLPLGGGMRQAMPSREDLELVAEVEPRVTNGYEVLLGHFRSLLRAAPNAHRRQCRECMAVEWHIDSVTPCVNCRHCGSQDTRRIQEEIEV